MRTLIVGAGTMGRWFGSVTSDRLAPTFADHDAATARATAEHCDGHAVDLDTEERFPIVCTAVPMSVTAQTIARYAPLAERAVVDLSGHMAEPLEAMRRHAPGRERIDLHPLFAPEHDGGRIAMVHEGGDTVGALLSDCLTDAGYDLFETTPEAHDRAMETVQAKTHAAVMAFALAADPVDPAFHTPVSERLAGLAARVTNGSPLVYADIQSHFAGADALAQAAERLASADEEEFQRLYREAGARFDVDDG